MSLSHNCGGTWLTFLYNIGSAHWCLQALIYAQLSHCPITAFHWGWPLDLNNDTVYLSIVHLRLYLNNFRTCWGPDFPLNEAEFSFSWQHYWCSVSGHAQPLHKWSSGLNLYVRPVLGSILYIWPPCFKPSFFSLALINHRFEQHVLKAVCLKSPC